MKHLLLSTLFLTLFFSCQKSEGTGSFEYWSRLSHQKYLEMQDLTESVPCGDIDAFEIVQAESHYFLVHPSIKSRFEKLKSEYHSLLSKMYEAANREGRVFDMLPPSPPLRKLCQDGIATLVYAYQLTIEEVNTELPGRYEEIMNLYHDIPCTDAADWQSLFLRVDCCYEGVAVHKTIRTGEFIEKVEIYSRLIERKLYLGNESCEAGNCKIFATPVQCVDGKPFVELVSE